MKAVVQLDSTGCAIASVAALTGRSYVDVKRTAASLGIDVSDAELWSRTTQMRRLLRHLDVNCGPDEEPFRGWEELPTLALLAIKWRATSSGPAWHWVVFVREDQDAYVLDPKRSLASNRRTDFGRMKPKWFIRIQEPARRMRNVLPRHRAKRDAG